MSTFVNVSWIRTENSVTFYRHPSHPSQQIRRSDVRDHIMRELMSKQEYFANWDPDISIETFSNYCPKDNVFAFHRNTEQWLPAIIIGPQFNDGFHPIHFWQDYPDFTYIVDPNDICSLRKIYNHAYHDGKHDGQKLRYDELQQSFDNGYNRGKTIQAAQINGAFEAGRLQEQKELKHTVRAFHATTSSESDYDSLVSFSDSIPQVTSFTALMPKEVSTGSSSLLEDIDAFTDLPDASPEECQRALAEFQKERAEYFQQEETAIRVQKIAAGKKILQAFQIKRKATLETGGTNTHCTPATTAPAPIYSEVTDLNIRDIEFPCPPPPSLLPTAILGSTCKHIFNNTISNRDVVPVSSPPPTCTVSPHALRQYAQTRRQHSSIFFSQ